VVYSKPDDCVRHRFLQLPILAITAGAIRYGAVIYVQGAPRFGPTGSRILPGRTCDFGTRNIQDVDFSRNAFYRMHCCSVNHNFRCHTASTSCAGILCTTYNISMKFGTSYLIQYMHIQYLLFLRLIVGILCVRRDGSVSPYIKTFILFEMILKTDLYLTTTLNNLSMLPCTYIFIYVGGYLMRKLWQPVPYYARMNCTDLVA
jgi:hypothetical protein